jgi:hypothetical protein
MNERKLINFSTELELWASDLTPAEVLLYQLQCAVFCKALAERACIEIEKQKTPENEDLLQPTLVTAEEAYAVTIAQLHALGSIVNNSFSEEDATEIGNHVNEMVTAMNAVVGAK